MGVQILAVAGGKFAKNGISDYGRVAFGGSLNFSTIGISNIFAGFVSRVMWQPESYICETFWGRIKKLGDFLKKCKKCLYLEVDLGGSGWPRKLFLLRKY